MSDAHVPPQGDSQSSQGADPYQPSPNYPYPPSGNYLPYPGAQAPSGSPPAGEYGNYPPPPVPPYGLYPPPYPPMPPQRQGLGAGATVGIVVGVILLVCIGVCALGAVASALGGSLLSSLLPTHPAFASSPTPHDPGAVVLPTVVPGPSGTVTVPPVPDDCCFNMTLGHDYGDNGQQLYIQGKTNTFYSYTDTFAYLVDLHGQSLTASNKPVGSTNNWLAVLAPDGKGGMVVVSKLEQDGGPSATGATECANSFAIVTLMQQLPAGQYEVEFLTADGTTRIADAIFDYYDEPRVG